jgi:hypothetical protein
VISITSRDIVLRSDRSAPFFVFQGGASPIDRISFTYTKGKSVFLRMKPGLLAMLLIIFCLGKWSAPVTGLFDESILSMDGTVKDGSFSRHILDPYRLDRGSIPFRNSGESVLRYISAL